jgi:8-oxo-dGTP pyrophosphatase MutT (NUDIX family)
MMERIDSKTEYEGRIATVRTDTFRYADGETAEREVVAHPGAVGVLAHDDEVVWLVRQPREAVGDPRLLEVPAGKLDVEGEPALECAQRELAEEVSLAATDWRELKRFYTSPGFAEEEVTLFEATGLSDAGVDADPGERIEVVRWPLADLDSAIEECRDSKSLIGLLILRQTFSGDER